MLRYISTRLHSRGSLRVSEYMAHECAKSSLAFRKLAVAAWPPPAAARPGLMAPRSASMALQALAPGELRGALGRLGYLCAGGAKAMFVAAQSRTSPP